MILTELILRRRWLRFILEVTVFVVVIAVALLVSSAVAGRTAFGGTSSIATVGIMFIATICGIGARYIFFLQKGQFSWLDVFKPITISPIVLLPLIGSIQTGMLNEMQVVSFAVLAFQNGFFWQAVLEGAKPARQQ